MARIKDKADFKEFNLSESEFEYIKAANIARNRVFEEQGRVLSAFLYYLAGTRFGYKTGTDLQFELDFDDPKRILKIKEVPTAPSPKAEDSPPQSPPAS